MFMESVHYLLIPFVDEPFEAPNIFKFKILNTYLSIYLKKTEFCD